jgi:peptide/nickel transport system substrate-binding protein
MTKTRLVVAAAMSAVLAGGLAACGQSPDDGSPDQSTPAFDAANGAVFNPSDATGGTLKYAISEDWDSVDPGDTYYGLSWNLLRLYGRSLTMFKPAPGKASQELVPDLAEGLGVPSDDGRTWTYTLREGLTYEDGTPIVSQDVKYAVLRTIDKEVLVNGPTYLGDFLDLQGYQGPYKDPGGDTNSIETPDDRTIVFHLNQPFGGFDYFAMLPATVPVPRDADTGARYKEHVISSGPYMFEEYHEGVGFTLVRNPNWDPATDPNRPALPDRIEVSLGVNANDIDNRLISGDLHVDLAGTGVQPAALSRVLSDPALRAQSDNPAAPRLWYTSINPRIEPLDDIECRKAILYATDRTGYQTAYGGELAGGPIATTLLPPQIPGYQAFDLYPAGPDNTGDLAAAQAALEACGQPDGFATKMAFRSDRPKEKVLAEAMQQALGRVGIELTLEPLPTGDYFSLYAGRPDYRDSEGLGLMTNGWQADWNDGFGFLSQIVDSRTIRESGGSSNLSVYIDEVDQMIDQAVAETDRVAREALWGEIDRRVMAEAVILPGVYSSALTLRGVGVTNVFVNEAFGQYDYMMMGVQQ